MSSAWGIAGWVTDTNSATDFGDRTNDGNNLCRVTLVRNRDASIPLDQSTTQTAQGQQLLCLVADGVRFPSPGDRVYVGMPEDHWKMPGGSIVLATVTANPAATGNLGDGDQVIFADPRTGSKIVARGDGALVLAATKTGKPGGPMVYLQIGGLAQGGLPQSSLKFQSPHGTMAYDDYGFRINDAFQNSIRMGGMGMPGILAPLGSYCTIMSKFISVDGAAVNLGSSVPGIYFPAVWGPAPAGTPQPILLAGVTSMSVKIAT